MPRSRPPARDPLRLGDAGPRGGGFRARVRGLRGRPPRLRGLQWHHRAHLACSSSACGRATRSSRSATPSSPRRTWSVLRGAPVFVDVHPDTFNMDPTLIEAVVTPRTRAILCVHQIGMPCDLAAILALARRHGLPVVEDAACAIGSEIQWNGDWERSAGPRRRGLLLVPSAQARLHRRRGHDHHGQRRVGRQDASLATARHERAGHHPPRLQAGDLRVVPDDGLQLPHDRHPGRGGPRAAQAPAGLPGAPPHAGPPVPGRLGWPCRFTLPVEPEWARTNWQSFCVRLADRLDQG